MNRSIPMLSLALLSAGSASMALSQAVPTSQPNLLTITREEVKTGHNAAHAAHEVGWPAAYAKAKSPYYYLAMVSMTGPNEAWYISSYASHAVYGESMKMESDNAALTAELARLSRADADHINSVRNIHAAARTDLSYGAFPDMGLARFWEITTFRVRPGHEEGFASAAKAYAAAAKRATPNASWRTYEVLAGLPGPTYFVCPDRPNGVAYIPIARDVALVANVADGMATEVTVRLWNQEARNNGKNFVLGRPDDILTLAHTIST